ncbi:Dynein heavy chain 6 axonemal, partial [Bienertia sinuspersici]
IRNQTLRRRRNDNSTYEVYLKKRKARIVNERTSACKAMIRLKQDKLTSDFVVVGHELQHNHDLVIEQERQQ